MGILDDAIKEHLELKRRHGAAEDELKQLEDEAFGAAERPGVGESPSEAPTEFMAQPDLAEKEDAPRSRRPDVADLQEAPPRTEPDEPETSEPALEPEPAAEEEAPAMEHEAIASGPSTEEREAIAEQPTEMFDVEAELDDTEAEGDDEEDDDFWDEKRLSDELDQALEAPSEVEDEEALYEDAAPEDEEPEPEQPENHVAPSDSEEDVLEETPDFLEETPEDDQLWFEQKPPKDFDFDD